jgi:hypothetical protein
MADEPATTPADNKENPGEAKLELPIDGGEISIKGYEGVTAKKEGGIIRLKFDQSIKSGRQATSGSKNNIITLPKQPTAPDGKATPGREEDDTGSNITPDTEAPTPAPAPKEPNPPTGKPAEPDTNKYNRGAVEQKNNEPQPPARPTDAATSTAPQAAAAQKTDPRPSERGIKRMRANNDRPLQSDVVPPKQTTPVPEQGGDQPAGQEPPPAPLRQNAPANQAAPVQPAPGQNPQPPSQATPDQGKKQGAAARNLNRAKALAKGMKNLATNPRQTTKNLGKGLADAGKKKLKGGIDKIKNAPKNIAKNSANNLRTDKMKKRKLLKEVEDINKDIRELQGKIKGMQSSLAMIIFKLLFPGLYSKIAGISEMPGDAAQSAKVNLLKAKVTSLRTVRNSLTAARLGAAFLDSIIDILEWIGPTFGIIILFAIIIIPLGTLLHYFIGGTVTSTIKRILKNVEDALKPLEEKLEREKKILNLMGKRKAKRQEIKNIETAAEQKQQEQPKPAEGGGGKAESQQAEQKQQEQPKPAEGGGGKAESQQSEPTSQSDAQEEMQQAA